MLAYLPVEEGVLDEAVRPLQITSLEVPRSRFDERFCCPQWDLAANP